MSKARGQNQSAFPDLNLPLAPTYPDAKTGLLAAIFHASGRGDLSELRRLLTTQHIRDTVRPSAAEETDLLEECRKHGLLAAARYGQADQASVIEYLYDEQACRPDSWIISGAIAEGQLSAVQTFVKRGEDMSNPEYFSNAVKHPAVWDLIINSGADVTAGAKDRRKYDQGVESTEFLSPDHAHTAIESAAAKGSLAQVKKLVELGANVRYGNALHHACQGSAHGRDVEETLAIMDYLIGLGCDVNEHDDKWYKKTIGRPLHWAADVVSSPEIFSLLLNKGADPTARNASGYLPLDTAQYENTLTPELSSLLGDHKSEDRLGINAQFAYHLAGYKPLSWKDGDTHTDLSLPWNAV